MAKYQKKKDPMLGEDQLDIMAPELEQSTGFPGEASLEEVEQEQAAGPDVGELQKRLAKLDSEANALTGLVKAQGDKPDTQILNRLSEIKREQASLQDLVKASPVSPVSPTEPATTVTAPTGTMTAETKPSTLLESMSSAKRQTEAPGQIGTVTPSQPLAGLKPEPEKPEDTLLARLKRAETGREDARKRADIGQVAEMVGRSLTQIGAAQQGMRTGADLSGVGQGKGIDWEARRAEIAKDYETELASVSKEREQLLEKERRAEEAKNNKELLALKKQELGLSQRETAAKIDKLRAETEVARKEAQKVATGLDKTALEAAKFEQQNYDKLNEKQYKVKVANAETTAALDNADRLAAEGKTDLAGFEDRAAVTAYLKQLDPESAVLAAEYAGAKDIGKLTGLLNSTFKDIPQAFKDYLLAGASGTLQPQQRKMLRDAANANFNARSSVFRDETKRILRRAQQAGIPNGVMIMGREPTPEEVDEITAKNWGIQQTAKPTETEATSKGTVAPRTKMPGVVGFKSADEFLQSRGK